ncbi:Rne/Rng family ribonuclease [Nocardioides sp. CFH 31398]|uniref:Rne/Rng family ribonuclease n=1 Tax=Nocardioides sp. CFH 31398 TaxID=2919579 RepID=UPI0035AC2735
MQAPDDTAAAAGPAPRKRATRRTSKKAAATSEEATADPGAPEATAVPAATDAPGTPGTPETPETDVPAPARKAARKATARTTAKKTAAKKTTARKTTAKRTTRKTAAADEAGAQEALALEVPAEEVPTAVDDAAAPQTPGEAPGEGPAVGAETPAGTPAEDAGPAPRKTTRRSRKKAAAAPLFQAPAPVGTTTEAPAETAAESAAQDAPAPSSAPEPATAEDELALPVAETGDEQVADDAPKPRKKSGGKKKSGSKKKKKADPDEAAAEDAASEPDLRAEPVVVGVSDDAEADEADEAASVEGAAAGDTSDDQADTSSSDDSDADADSDDDTGEGGGRRRRRRRGGRRRRKGGGSDGSGDSDETRDDTAEQESAKADDADTGDDASPREESGGGSTRRRRRRRAGEAADTDDADPSTVTRVRRARSPEDEITAVAGSTRLEAKKQRRREGREAGRRRAPIVSEAEFLARRESVDRSMVVRQRDDLTQIAVLEDGVLVEHYVARESQTSLIGNVYLGRVQNVLPSMEAAFIDIGKGRNAVLYAGEVNWSALGHSEGQPRKIESVLSSGQSVLVQVTKDPVGQKGARLTSQISLAGRFLVYVPDGTTSGISRKLPDTERSRLKSLLKEIVPEGASVIVRTAAEGATEEQLTRDVERLTARWADIESRTKGGAPALLYGEPDLTLKVVRDLFTEDFAELVVDGDAAWDTVHGYVAHVAPDLEDRVVRHEVGETGKDAFAVKRIDEQIAKGLDRKVWLPSGGSLIIDRTEAMTVVDVNTGKFTGSGGNLEETVTKNNLEAAEEMVRQLRLRDIGGIIVIDFIDMVLESNRDLVLRRLVECLGRDRTRHQVAEVTSLGLVQLTRKRIGTGLLEAFSEPCESCGGRGLTVHEMPVEPSGGNDDGDGRRGGRRRGGRNRNGENGNGGNGGTNGNGNTNGNGGNGGSEQPTPPRPTPSPSYVAAVAKPENADRAPLDVEPEQHEPTEPTEPKEPKEPTGRPAPQDPAEVTVDEPVEDVAEAALVATEEAPQEPADDVAAPPSPRSTEQQPEPTQQPEPEQQPEPTQQPEPEQQPEPTQQVVDTAPRTVTRTTTRRRAVRPAGSPEGATAAVVVADPAAAPTVTTDAPPPPKVVTTTRSRRARRTTPTELGDREDHGGA